MNGPHPSLATAGRKTLKDTDDKSLQCLPPQVNAVSTHSLNHGPRIPGVRSVGEVLPNVLAEILANIQHTEAA